MTNEEILANAPDNKELYCEPKTEGYPSGKSFADESPSYITNSLFNVRSLSDIRRIVELEQKLETAERERDDYKRIAVDAATESFLIAADNEIKRALAQDNKSVSAINHYQRQIHHVARSCAISCVDNQLRQQLNGGEHADCELECGAYSTYCKCKSEKLAQQDKGGV